MLKLRTLLLPSRRWIGCPLQAASRAAVSR
jgi:hypothetical protein